MRVVLSSSKATSGCWWISLRMATSSGCSARTRVCTSAVLIASSRENCCQDTYQEDTIKDPRPANADNVSATATKSAQSVDAR